MDINKFALNAGELSDEMAGRPDLMKTQMGCEVAENVRVLRAGGQTRRAGMRYGALVFDVDVASRLQGFRFSGQQGYTLEFSNQKMRVFKNGVLVTDGVDPLEYDTPWTDAQVFALDFAQRVNKIVVTHPEVEPYEIIMNADGTWAVQAFAWQERIWELATDDIITMTPSAVSGTVTITAGEDIFTSAWEGTRLRLAHSRPEAPTKKTIGSITNPAVLLNLVSGVYAAGAIVYVLTSGYTRTLGKYAGISPVGARAYFTLLQDYDGATDFVSGDTDPDEYPAFFMQGVLATPEQDILGEWRFETFGTWTATYTIERSFDGGLTWNSVKVASSSDDKNFLVQDTETQSSNARFRVLILDANTTGTTEDRFDFTALSVQIFGVALIVEFLTATTVTALVTKDFESASPTTEWYEDALCPKNGYANACTYHQKRLYFGGSTARPQTVWASRIKEPYNFLMGTLADDGLSFEAEAEEFESVRWLVSHLNLLVGTSSGVWAITSPYGQTVTPESNSIVRQLHIGVADGIVGVPLQSNVLYLQDKGRKIQELTGGAVDYGGYTSADMTQLASHVTRGGVTQMAGGRVPDSALYMVTGGELAVLTYERAQNVVGWTRWVTDGTIESVAVCPGAGEDDDVYISVNRNGVRTVEWLTPDMLRVEESQDTTNLAFLDSYVRKQDEAGFSVLDGLDHLEGREVEVFADGEPVGKFVVSGNEIDLGRTFYNAIAGLPYSSFIRPMPLDQGTIGDKSSAREVVIRFRNTLGADVSQDGEHWTVVDFVQPRFENGEPPKLLSGDFTANVHSTWERGPTITIRQSQPLPMTVLAIRIKGKTSR